MPVLLVVWFLFCKPVSLLVLALALSTSTSTSSSSATTHCHQFDLAIRFFPFSFEIDSCSKGVFGCLVFFLLFYFFAQQQLNDPHFEIHKDFFLGGFSIEQNFDSIWWFKKSTSTCGRYTLTGWLTERYIGHIRSHSDRPFVYLKKI